MSKAYDSFKPFTNLACLKCTVFGGLPLAFSTATSRCNSAVWVLCLQVALMPNTILIEQSTLDLFSISQAFAEFLVRVRSQCRWRGCLRWSSQRLRLHVLIFLVFVLSLLASSFASLCFLSSCVRIRTMREHTMSMSLCRQHASHLSNADHLRMSTLDDSLEQIPVANCDP